MEYTQWEQRVHRLRDLPSSLNPCCNGIYSMSNSDFTGEQGPFVLILVVMEYTQWEQRLTYPLYKAFWFIISMTAIVI